MTPEDCFFISGKMAVPERIYVGNLAPRLVTDLQLGRFFAQFGQVSGGAPPPR